LNSNLSIVEELEPAYSTTWEEHIFIGDHNDAPKDACTVQYALHKALQDVQQKFAVTCIRKVTDRGGENWGTQALSKYSQYGDVDIVWAPTCENHSGQPSDSSGGTCKKDIRDETKAGRLEGVNTAAELCAKLAERPPFKESDQSRFLNAKIIKRKYHLLSRERVQPFIDAEEKVNKVPGVSQIHQAFSTKER